MQLFAFNSNGEKIFVENAVKRHNYFCPECQLTLRLRGGNRTRLHFYHLNPKTTCSQNNKSVEHLQVQLHLSKIFSDDQAIIEHQFSKIQRIADVYWKPHRIVFEVQFSPISVEEVKLRLADYASANCWVVWILSTKNFMSKKFSPLRLLLKHYPHYFVTIDSTGQISYFDEIAIDNKKETSFYHSKVDLSKPIFPKQSKNILSLKSLPLSKLWQYLLPCKQKIQLPNELIRNRLITDELKRRRKMWPFYFFGDFLSKTNCDLSQIK